MVFYDLIMAITRDGVVDLLLMFLGVAVFLFIAGSLIAWQVQVVFDWRKDKARRKAMTKWLIGEAEQGYKRYERVYDVDDLFNKSCPPRDAEY